MQGKTMRGYNLLSRLREKEHIVIEVRMDEKDLTST